MTYTNTGWMRHRWILQSPTNPAEFAKALAAAQREAEEVGLSTSYDHWLMIGAEGDEIVLWFDVSGEIKPMTDLATADRVGRARHERLARDQAAAGRGAVDMAIRLLREAQPSMVP